MRSRDKPVWRGNTSLKYYKRANDKRPDIPYLYCSVGIGDEMRDGNRGSITFGWLINQSRGREFFLQDTEFLLMAELDRTSYHFQHTLKTQNLTCDWKISKLRSNYPIKPLTLAVEFETEWLSI